MPCPRFPSLISFRARHVMQTRWPSHSGRMLRTLPKSITSSSSSKYWKKLTSGLDSAEHKICWPTSRVLLLTGNSFMFLGASKTFWFIRNVCSCRLKWKQLTVNDKHWERENVNEVRWKLVSVWIIQSVRWNRKCSSTLERPSIMVQFYLLFHAPSNNICRIARKFTVVRIFQASFWVEENDVWKPVAAIVLNFATDGYRLPLNENSARSVGPALRRYVWKHST